MQKFLSWFAPVFIEHVHDSPHDMATSLKPARVKHPEHNHLFDVFEHQWYDFMKGPIEDTVDILVRLDDAQVPLFALTNWPHQVWPPRGPEDADPGQHDYRFIERFQDIVVSGQVRMRKPNDDIYLHALETFGVRANEAVFVDDLLENVETANRLGMTGLQFVGAETLERDLVRLDIL